MKKRERISRFTALLMLGVAVMFDFLQFLFSTIFAGLAALTAITVVGAPLALAIGAVFSLFVSLISGIIFFIWFKLLGVNFLSGGGKKLFSYFGVGFGDAALSTVPIASAFSFGITLSIGLTINIVRLEDTVYNEKQKLT